jgi:hypothetical protein
MKEEEMSASTTRRNRGAAFIGAGIAAGIIGAWALSANGPSGMSSGSGIPATSITSTTSAPAATSGASQPAAPPVLPASIGDDEGGADR